MYDILLVFEIPVINEQKDQETLKTTALPRWLSGEHVELMNWWL